jgi:hypothetical protein
VPVEGHAIVCFVLPRRWPCSQSCRVLDFHPLTRGRSVRPQGLRSRGIYSNRSSAAMGLRSDADVVLLAGAPGRSRLEDYADQASETIETQL